MLEPVLALAQLQGPSPARSRSMGSRRATAPPTESPWLTATGPNRRLTKWFLRTRLRPRTGTPSSPHSPKIPAGSRPNLIDWLPHGRQLLTVILPRLSLPPPLTLVTRKIPQHHQAFDIDIRCKFPERQAPAVIAAIKGTRLLIVVVGYLRRQGPSAERHSVWFGGLQKPIPRTLFLTRPTRTRMQRVGQKRSSRGERREGNAAMTTMTTASSLERKLTRTT